VCLPSRDNGGCQKRYGLLKLSYISLLSSVEGRIHPVDLSGFAGLEDDCQRVVLSLSPVVFNYFPLKRKALLPLPCDLSITMHALQTTGSNVS
jgi:hypothetical protein